LNIVIVRKEVVLYMRFVGDIKGIRFGEMRLIFHRRKKARVRKLTNEQAIKILCDINIITGRRTTAINNALRVAKKALEKQIPAKLDMCHCVCGAAIWSSLTYYCHNCGQRVESEGGDIG
jgi:hypothetical protein